MKRKTILRESELELFLKEKGFERISTPMFLPFQKVLPYLSSESVNHQVKVQGPKGETLLMRGDSTVAMVVSECLSQVSKGSDTRIYYDEPHFQYDFEKQVIREDRQLGLEVVSSNVQSALEESLQYAVHIAELKCEKKILLEVGLPSVMADVIKAIALETQVDVDQLLYYLKRKNVYEVSKLLKKGQRSSQELELIAQLLTSPRNIEIFIDESKNIDILLPIRRRLAQMPQIRGVQVEFEPSILVDRPYYSHVTFKIYDTERHETFISGGTYDFDAYGISGCGFSVQLGGES